MNFFSTVINSYIICALLIIILLLRDLHFPKKEIKRISKPRANSSWKKFVIYYMRLANKPIMTWATKDRAALWVAIAILGIGIIVGIDTRYIEPNLLLTKDTRLKICGLNQPIKVALVTDIQVGLGNQDETVQRIVNKIESAKPDLVIIGGDLIDNEGTQKNESIYLDPLKQLVGKYPIYYVMGNHEYGIGSKTQYHPNWQTGDKSEQVIQKMKEIGIPLLRNQLQCATINAQKLCIFGGDDIWKRPLKFSDLRQWDQVTPLLFLSHNPDGILYWPKNIKQPSAVLSGHTHGGQIWLPFIGPMGDAQLDLGNSFYKGLNYYGYTPVITSNGIGVSGGPIRFFAPPKIDMITLTP